MDAFICRLAAAAAILVIGAVAYRRCSPSPPPQEAPRRRCGSCHRAFALSRDPRPRREGGPLFDMGFRCFRGSDGREHHLCHWDRADPGEFLYDWEVACGGCGALVPIPARLGELLEIGGGHWGPCPDFGCPDHVPRAMFV